MENVALTNQKILEVKDRRIDNLCLSYTLYRSFEKISDRYAYSVEISVFDGTNSETRFVSDITSLKGRAEEIFELLYENSVTPCTLTDVLEDIL